MSNCTEEHIAGIDLFELGKEFEITINIGRSRTEEKAVAEVSLYHPESGFETSKSIQVSNIIEAAKAIRKEAAGIRRAIESMERAGRPVVP